VSLLLFAASWNGKTHRSFKGSRQMAVCLPDGCRNIHLQLLRLPQALLETVHLQSQGLAGNFLVSVSFLTEADAKCPLNRCIMARSKKQDLPGKKV